MRLIRTVPLVLAAIFAAAGAAPASAALVGQSMATGIAALQEWNVVSFNNFSSSNHVDGRIFVGGNFTSGNMNVNGNNTPASNYGTAAVTVVGNANLQGANINLQGGVDVGGNVSGFFNLNGTPKTVDYGGTSTATANNVTFTDLGPSFTNTLNSQKTDIIASLTSLSSNLAALANTGGVVVGGDQNNQSITVSGSGLKVLNWSEAMFEGTANQALNITLANDATLVINVAGTDIDMNRNFNTFANDERVLFNFYQATTLDLNRQFSGSVLGVFADITAGNSGNVDGNVIGKSVIQNANGEIHNNYFQGDLSSVGGSQPVVAPEPATWGLMILGFGLIGFAMRSRSRRSLVLQAA